MPTPRLRLRTPGAARPPWPDLAPLVNGKAPGALTEREARLWSLVLRARRVPHRMRALGGGITVQVPQRFTRRAVEEIHLYHEENVPPHPSIPLPPLEERTRPTVAAMLALCGFFILTHRPLPVLGSYPQYWAAAGTGDAGAILDGQLWRLFTALTLHADPAHVASNACVGGAFLILLARRVGSGPAWLVAVVAGGLGNLLNAWAQGPGHNSIGFSTAVFGAAGALAGLRAVTEEIGLRDEARRALRSWLLPVAAGLGLLASLGTAGENTDVGAHFFGLVAGVCLGALWGHWRTGKGPLGEGAGRLCGALAGLLPAAAWAVGYLAR